MMSAAEGLKSETLKSVFNDRGRKIPVKLLPATSTHVTHERNQSVASSYVSSKGIKEHVKGRLSLGAKLLQMGKTEKLFKRVFSINEGEQLLKAFHCCLSTTAGPIAGILFISTDKSAFRSDKSVVKLTSPTGESVRFCYKVVIPFRKIQRVSQSHNAIKASQKYLQVVTMDNFEFWFMGFLSYSKMFKCLQNTISQTQQYAVGLQLEMRYS